ncbi:MAG: exodeoxyribonuclease VII small subunit [Planctomycetes bacterium]|nr:exodeoxyribonuclease VII small subunit [Planctomycetota bacterium]
MTARRRKEKEGASFEEQLAELQRIVAALEDGELPLLEAIEQYRAGIGALKRCRELLDAARGTVEMLTRESAESSASAAAVEGETEHADDDEEEDAVDDDDGGDAGELRGERR